jgi:hypothetical protein
LANLIKYGRVFDFLVAGQNQLFAHNFGGSGIIIRKWQKNPSAMLAVNRHTEQDYSRHFALHGAAEMRLSVVFIPAAPAPLVAPRNIAPAAATSLRPPSLSC